MLSYTFAALIAMKALESPSPRNFVYQLSGLHRPLHNSLDTLHFHSTTLPIKIARAAALVIGINLSFLEAFRHDLNVDILTSIHWRT